MKRRLDMVSQAIQVKHMSTTTGTVKWFNETKGFGFIVPDAGGDDAFVHITAVKESGVDRLEDNQRVEFDLAEGRNGKVSVKTLKLID